MKCNQAPTIISNNNIPLNTLPFHNCDKPTFPTMPSRCDSSDCYKANDDSKWKIFKNALAYFTFE